MIFLNFFAQKIQKTGDAGGKRLVAIVNRVDR